jgi:hypothetical protein
MRHSKMDLGQDSPVKAEEVSNVSESSTERIPYRFSTTGRIGNPCVSPDGPDPQVVEVGDGRGVEYAGSCGGVSGYAIIELAPGLGRGSRLEEGARDTGAHGVVLHIRERID